MEEIHFYLDKIQEVMRTMKCPRKEHRVCSRERRTSTPKVEGTWFKTPSAPKRPRLCRPRTLLRKRTNQNADESILPKWEVSPISNESGPILIGSDSESELACIPLEFSEEDQKENHVQEEDQEEIIIPP
ncbi:uncharacterized protein LOC134241380 [Saccostrea cucullata]|uniref:uncharacterized protein LOC134241380 n=1 Tax=Saccostrea cuccullata TaxID=36930 RepID=UPI002ED01818